jgi:hypothetical protein
MLTAVQSLRLFAVEMAPWFPERNALTTEQHDEFRNGHHRTKPPGFGLLRASQLSGFRRFEKAGNDEIPRSALTKSGDAHRSPKPSALCYEYGPVVPGTKRVDD